MAQGYFLFSTSTSNASTQSAVAMASYRSGEKLYSLKDGETKFFKKRFVEPESFILKPDHAPSWTLHRETLWNEVEAFENRDNARLSRNVLVALPNNMTSEQQRETTEAYVQKNFVDHGMVADTSIHRDDENNPHAHIMLTVRAFDESGNWETRKSKRVPKLDQEGNQIYNAKGWRETKSIKLNDWDSKKKLLEWRENWSALLNEKSRKYGLDRTYSHKSFKEQGRMEKPEIRLTREEYQFEQRQKERSVKKGIAYQPTTYYAKKNEEVKAYNRSLASVLHLQDYKTEESFNELFKQVRRRKVYDPEKIEATRKIAERTKTYIDFSVAKKVYADFHSPTNKWKQKLERDVHNLNAKKSFFRHLLSDYSNHPPSVLKYGYSIDHFREEVREELQRLEKTQEKFQEEREKYREFKHASALALEYQKELLTHEFNAVYNQSHHLAYEEMHYAVQLMKEHQIKVPLDKIKHEYHHSDHENRNIHDPAWKQAKDTLFTLKLYDRTLRKLGQQRSLSPEDLKNHDVKYDTFQRLKEQYTNTLNELSPFIDEEIKETFPGQVNNQVLEQTDVETKSYLLEKYHQLSEEEQQHANLDSLMKDALEESRANYNTINQLQKTNEHNFEKEDYKTQSDKYSNIIRGIVSMFEEMSKQRTTNNKMKNNRDRTKAFRRKGTDGREL